MIERSDRFPNVSSGLKKISLLKHLKIKIDKYTSLSQNALLTTGNAHILIKVSQKELEHFIPPPMTTRLLHNHVLRGEGGAGKG